MSDKVRLLIVDDSALMRQAIAGICEESGSIEVVGQAADGKEALQMVEMLKPDVVTLDVSMPVMDGISALKHLMIYSPMPVVMLSSLTTEGASITFDALRYGAVDFIAKPSSESERSMDEQKSAIVDKIMVAASIHVEAAKFIRLKPGQSAAALTGEACTSVVAMGAGEGGYAPLLKILPQLQAYPGLAFLVTLYAAEQHVAAFAEYLQSITAVTIKMAGNGDVIQPGVCYLNSGENYMSVHNDDGPYFTLHVSPAPFADTRRGSVDMLLFSTADVVAENAVGIILSGNGKDGAEGLEEVLRMNGQAIVQHPNTCFCKDMVHAALDRSPVEHMVADVSIASTIEKILR